MSRIVECKRCGWRGEDRELLTRTVYEDFGDVVCAVCPNCRRTEYDGDEMFFEPSCDEGKKRDE